jgi:raffinose/stachyose/melibiose transport system permease protein/xylobiose transport system permease protein
MTARPAPFRVARHTPGGRRRWPGRLGPLSRSGGLVGNILAAFWLVVVAAPLYFMLITSLRTSDAYVEEGALSAPSGITLGNYGRVLDLGFATFLGNSAFVTVATVVLVLALALPASYSIVRSRSRSVRLAFSVFLLGLAIPAQAVIIPLYLIITRLHLYDSLTAIILPTVAFSLPVAMVVLTSHLRDIPKELYESMIMDGGTPTSIFFQLVVPSSRPALVSVGIYSGLNAWNGFIFPLVFTQSRERQVVPLGLWNFQSQFGTDAPGLFAAVLISAVPVLALYLFGRRHLLRGLSAGYGK